MPTVSVIVPVYKTEKYLGECIESILNQTFKDFEMILVDDGSPDNSGKICDDYAAQDSRIRVFHKENGGVSSARNMGIKYARSELLSFLDSDDSWSPVFLEKMIKLMRRFPEAGYGVCAHAISEGGRMSKLISKPLKGFSDGGFGVFDLFDHIENQHKSLWTGNLLYFPVCTGSVIMRRATCLRHGCFSENLVEGEDWKLWFESALVAPVAFLNEVLLFYRKADDVTYKPRGTHPPLNKVWSFTLSRYQDAASHRPSVRHLLNRFRWLLLFRYKGVLGLEEEMKTLRSEIDAEDAQVGLRFLYVCPSRLVTWLQRLRALFRNFSFRKEMS
ncbi:MAG: glycosyltransferase family 2 protein [Opitutales bacterium]|nr:glycosyltransferase family 2 protein [Opitutales bacterium]